MSTMILAVVAVGILVAYALSRIAAELRLLRQETDCRAARETDRQTRSEAALSQVVEELNQVRTAIIGLKGSFATVSKELSELHKILGRLAPEPTTQSKQWEMEREMWLELRATAAPLGPEEFVRFVAYRYELSLDDPWLLSMLKLRNTVGLDAVVTALRTRDKHHGADPRHVSPTRTVGGQV